MVFKSGHRKIREGKNRKFPGGQDQQTSTTPTARWLGDVREGEGGGGAGTAQRGLHPYSGT